ncbi:tail assembly protein [Rhizobium phage P11VFA]|nr:tail assembly protein [Rhizobium phage P11VFA]
MNEWKAHAVSKFPNEACGFILKDGSFLPMENLSPEPRKNFIINETEEVYERGIVAFLHSHTPDDPDENGRVQPVALGPSKSDMEGQISCDYPWGISVCDGENTTTPLWFGDQLEPRPLLGRVFVHGIWDCYSLIRDWHRTEAGIIIPEYPREFSWWGSKEEGYPGEDMYEANFKDAGFERVHRDRGPLPGDVFICRLKSTVLNHAGVYIGDDHILHHAAGALSMRSPASRWHSKLDFLVRHKDMPEPEDAA